MDVNKASDEEIPKKKIKLIENNESSAETLTDLSNLNNFAFKRVLSDRQETKSVFIEGNFNDKSASAILLLEKEPFEEKNLTTLFKEDNEQEKLFQNDIYSSFRYYPKSTFNGIKVTAIYPATEKHFKKYQFQPVHMINESAELYTTVTRKCIEEEQFSLQWVYNILEHKSEAERIVFEDTDPEIGFILIPDLKWDGKTLETLYLLALPHVRGIMSIRDLTEKHLPLLENILRKGVKAIEEKYSLPESQLRIYFHYQPTFYHLHVHFTFVQYSAPGSACDRAHLLTTVINNIKIKSNYYQEVTLPFTIKQEEARPRLRACNICITLKESVTSDLKISLQKMKINLIKGDEKFLINFVGFEVEPLTMTGLSLKNKYITFRVQIDCEFDSVVKKIESVAAPLLNNTPNRIKCRCGNLLSKEIVFDRVLPLPSNNWDSTDVFCHAHGYKLPEITPRMNDCLYGNNFIMINDKIINNGEKFVKCNRCSKIIGVHQKDFLKIWTVNLILPFENLSPLEEFLKLISNAVAESLSIFVKLLIECQEIDNYLLLCVMDKQLLLYEAEDDLILKKRSAMKLSYSYHTSSNENVKKWEDETFVQHLLVSQCVLTAGFEYLLRTSRKIPPLFNMANGEFLAYLSN